MKTLTKKTTHIASVRQVNDSQIQRICELMQWSHQEYCEYQYLQFELFIDRLCKDLPKASTTIRYSPIFRGFFNNEWIRRNEEEFLPLVAEMSDTYFEVDSEGELKITEGFENGHGAFLWEYDHIHSARGLFYNEQFGTKVGYIIDQIIPNV